MKGKKYALLDTDFISKTYFIHDNAGKHLTDMILEMPMYTFFCHQKVVEELTRHNQDAIGWLNQKIQDGSVQCFSDGDILKELIKIRGDFACAAYTQMLKAACDAFSKSYFRDHYNTLNIFDYLNAALPDYQKALQQADEEIGKHSSIGEIKSYVLLQLLALFNGEQVYVFCSDDKVARNGAISFENVRCISAVSSFLRLKKELLWTWDEAQPYIDSFVDFCEEHKQQTFKVIEASDVARVKRVPCRQVLEEIFDDRFIDLQNGFLKYRPNVEMQ
ncbi:MAG: hypothetical protein Q4C91_02755 [Eubacteriales bacterium]|nr:hypothetical protein [Eubacteriales bacterium]